MTDPRQLLDAYERENAGNDDHAPLAFDALRAVLDLHVPSDPDCLPECTHCYDEGGVVHVPWPCPTVQAIVTALEAK